MSTWFCTLAQFSALAHAVFASVSLTFSDFLLRAVPHQRRVRRSVDTGRQPRGVPAYLHPTLSGDDACIHFHRAVGRTVLVAAPGLIMLAGLAYLFGCFGVTMRGNVPMKGALDRMDLSEEATLDSVMGPAHDLLQAAKNCAGRALLHTIPQQKNARLPSHRLVDRSLVPAIFGRQSGR